MTSRASGSDGGGPAAPPQPVVCARCGVRAEGAQRLTWTCSVETGTRHRFCDRCARDHLRAIEGRLDSAWW